MLTTDILFGNMNKMATIWVHRTIDYSGRNDFFVEGFKEGMEEVITEDGYNEVHQIEKIKST